MTHALRICSLALIFAPCLIALPACSSASDDDTGDDDGWDPFTDDDGADDDVADDDLTDDDATPTACDDAQDRADECDATIDLPAFCDAGARCRAECILNASCSALTNPASAFAVAFNACLDACDDTTDDDTTDDDTTDDDTTDDDTADDDDVTPDPGLCEDALDYMEGCGMTLDGPLFSDDCVEAEQCMATCMLDAPCCAYAAEPDPSCTELRGLESCLLICSGEAPECHPDNPPTDGSVCAQALGYMSASCGVPWEGILYDGTCDASDACESTCVLDLPCPGFTEAELDEMLACADSCWPGGRDPDICEEASAYLIYMCELPEESVGTDPCGLRVDMCYSACILDAPCEAFSGEDPTARAIFNACTDCCD